jgi:hypothetical protein
MQDIANILTAKKCSNEPDPALPSHKDISHWLRLTHPSYYSSVTIGTTYPSPDLSVLLMVSALILASQAEFHPPFSKGPITPL